MGQQYGRKDPKIIKGSAAEKSLGTALFYQ
jgi:hypothetical protein